MDWQRATPDEVGRLDGEAVKKGPISGALQQKRLGGKQLRWTTLRACLSCGKSEDIVKDGQNLRAASLPVIP